LRDAVPREGKAEVRPATAIVRSDPMNVLLDSLFIGDLPIIDRGKFSSNLHEERQACELV
jgi:hypothetical protein